MKWSSTVPPPSGTSRTVAAAYAAADGDRVGRLVLIAPQWLDDRPIPLDPGGPIGAYRLVAVGELEARWLAPVPPEAPRDVLPDGWFAQWAEATLAEEPAPALRARGLLRAANGPIQDVRDHWAVGRPFYDPRAAQVPVLLLHGEWDRDVPIDAALALFSALRPPYKRWVALGSATHMLLLERARTEAIQHIVRFLDEDRYSGRLRA